MNEVGFSPGFKLALTGGKNDTLSASLGKLLRGNVPEASGAGAESLRGISVDLKNPGAALVIAKFMILQALVEVYEGMEPPRSLVNQSSLSKNLAVPGGYDGSPSPSLVARSVFKTGVQMYESAALFRKNLSYREKTRAFASLLGAVHGGLQRAGKIMEEGDDKKEAVEKIASLRDILKKLLAEYYEEKVKPALGEWEEKGWNAREDAERGETFSGEADGESRPASRQPAPGETAAPRGETSPATAESAPETLPTEDSGDPPSSPELSAAHSADDSEETENAAAEADEEESAAAQPQPAPSSEDLPTPAPAPQPNPRLRLTDPLILDVEGDGISLTGIRDGVGFDIEGGGEKVRTAFVRGDDALLAYDRNMNGIIDNGRELFGNQNGARDGFEELAGYDVNADGVIDVKDLIRKHLLLWQDKNGDGFSQGDELKTLLDLGIKSINLEHTAVGQTDEEGNLIEAQATYTREDGSIGGLIDAWLVHRKSE